MAGFEAHGLRWPLGLVVLLHPFGYDAAMISVNDQLRKAIMNSGETAYMIGKGSGVHKSQLSRLLHDNLDPRIGTVERLADYLGYELVLRPKGRTRKAVK